MKRLLLPLLLSIIFFNNYAFAFIGSNCTKTASDFDPITGSWWDITYQGETLLYTFNKAADSNSTGIKYVNWENSDGLSGQTGYCIGFFGSYEFEIQFLTATKDVFLQFVINNSSMTGNSHIKDIGSSGPYTASPFTGVKRPNQQPIANAGVNQTVKNGDYVILDATASSDPDDGIVNYHWEQTSGLATTSVTGTQIYSFYAPDAGATGTIMTFKLTATDKGGLTSTDSTTVIIEAVAPPATDPPVDEPETPDDTQPDDENQGDNDQTSSSSGSSGGGCFINSTN